MSRPIFGAVASQHVASSQQPKNQHKPIFGAAALQSQQIQQPPNRSSQGRPLAGASSSIRLQNNQIQNQIPTISERKIIGSAAVQQHPSSHGQPNENQFSQARQVFGLRQHSPNSQTRPVFGASQPQQPQQPSRQQLFRDHQNKTHIQQQTRPVFGAVASQQIPQSNAVFGQSRNDSHLQSQSLFGRVIQQQQVPNSSMHMNSRPFDVGAKNAASSSFMGSRYTSTNKAGNHDATSTPNITINSATNTAIANLLNSSPFSQSTFENDDNIMGESQEDSTCDLRLILDVEAKLPSLTSSASATSGTTVSTSLSKDIYNMQSHGLVSTNDAVPTSEFTSFDPPLVDLYSIEFLPGFIPCIPPTVR